MSTIKPYYRRRRFAPTLKEVDFRRDGKSIDFSKVSWPGFGAPDATETANKHFDNRSAAVVAAGMGAGIDSYLIERKAYSSMSPALHLLLGHTCHALMAYADFFADTTETGLRDMVSNAIPYAVAGYCGSFGPGMDDLVDLLRKTEGNYDMNQMHILPIAYGYFNELIPSSRERLIRVLLAQGRIHRPGCSELFTSGPVANDWSRAGFANFSLRMLGMALGAAFGATLGPLGAVIGGLIGGLVGGLFGRVVRVRMYLKDIGETENHILMMLTTRYLTNQLLYQRDRDIKHDNRRNGFDGAPTCLDLVLTLLRNVLSGDFSEYNAKNYQEETRWALLNLCSYAYDKEVRLAARMVLDYVSAHIAVSSVDLRRMVPFRRRNETKYARHDAAGFMTISLINGEGEDPLMAYYAIQAGNIRSCRVGNEAGLEGSGQHITLEILSEYRLPPLIHDLFVNDRHRRFFQRLHRTPRNEVGGNRNVDNMEIYASSPSYLITAGGAPGIWAIDPKFAGIVMPDNDQQKGVAVTTSFIPTTGFAGQDIIYVKATNFIQLSCFSDVAPPSEEDENSVMNYGVAPDFACGHQIYLPSWTGISLGASGFQFADHSAMVDEAPIPGFYLAVLQDDGMAVLEAFDTWLHPGVTFEKFKTGVINRNGGLKLKSNVQATYVTTNGSRIEFVIWRNHERGGARFGAQVLSVVYGSDAPDAIGDAGSMPNHLLNGTILRSGPSAVIRINNTGMQIKLDMSDKWHPRRTDESGLVDSAGANEEVWADFEWNGPSEGDVCRPYSTVAAASAAVAPGGTIRMIPSVSHERSPIGVNKRFIMLAPIGEVKIGA